MLSSHAKRHRVSLSCGPLDHQSLNLELDRSDLSSQVTRFVRRDAARDHGARHSAGASERSLARDIDVRDVLVFGCRYSKGIELDLPNENA